MSRQDELDLFLLRCDELIESKYILADIKIVGLLKAIAGSTTIMAIFETCLKDFDYEKEFNKCFISSEFLGKDKGEYKAPENSKILLALVFRLLMDIDAKNLPMTEFLSRYFYEGGSFYQGYTAFIEGMVVPFKFTVKKLMTGIINGSVGDPVAELNSNDADKKEDKNKPVIDDVKEYLKKDREKVDAVKNEEKKEDGLFIIDTLVGALDSGDKDAIRYAFLAYKYSASIIIPFGNKIKYVNDLIKKLDF